MAYYTGLLWSLMRRAARAGAGLFARVELVCPPSDERFLLDTQVASRIAQRLLELDMQRRLALEHAEKSNRNRNSNRQQLAASTEAAEQLGTDDEGDAAADTD